MRKILFFIVLFGLQNQCRAGCFEFYAEYLVMRNSRSLPYFAAPVFDNGQHFANRSSWNSGYRLEGAYRFCPDDGLHLRWTSFPQFSNSRTIDNGQLLRDTIGGTNNGTAVSDRVKTRLENLELFYMHDFCFCNPFFLSLLAGVQYSHIHVIEKLDVFGNTNVAPGAVIEDIFKSARWGIGPELGIELGYSFCRCLSAEMRTSGSWMIARRTKEWLEPITASKIRDDVIWISLPFVDARLGLNFHTSCWNIQAGYEIFTYTQGTGRFLSFDLVDFYEDLSMYGFYFQIGYLF
jgi:hypothetical protein